MPYCAWLNHASALALRCSRQEFGQAQSTRQVAIHKAHITTNQLPLHALSGGETERNEKFSRNCHDNVWRVGLECKEL